MWIGPSESNHSVKLHNKLTFLLFTLLSTILALVHVQILTLLLLAKDHLNILSVTYLLTLKPKGWGLAVSHTRSSILFVINSGSLFLSVYRSKLPKRFRVSTLTVPFLFTEIPWPNETFPFWGFLYSRMGTCCSFHSMGSIFKYHLNNLYFLSKMSSSVLWQREKKTTAFFPLLILSSTVKFRHS